MILVDTGPLVALIHEDDNEHRACKDAFASFNEPLGTVWPVLTEAIYLFELLVGSADCPNGNDRDGSRGNPAVRRR